MASGDGGEEEDLGMFVDALPLPDDFDDVLHLLDIPDVAEAEPPVLQPPLATAAAAVVPAQQHNADYYDYQPAVSCSTHGLSGNARPYWPRMMFADGCYSTGAAVHGEPSTSAAAADCSGCQVLREVVHSNGLEVAKLCIHGGPAPGVFNHAMADVYTLNNNSGGSAPQSMTHHSCIDFRGRDYDWVRRYLKDYALRRAAGNYALVSDSLSVFHDVLCTDMNPSIILLDDDGGGGHELPRAAGTNASRQLGAVVDSAAAVQPTIQIRNTEPDQRAAGPSQTPRCATDVRVQQPFHPVAAGRSALALQRERTGKMKFDDIAPYFHLPIVEAAEKLDVCTTVLKGICRRVGVQRWPHRKVKKIDREITKLRRSGNGAWQKNQIQRLSAERRRIFDGIG